MKSDRGNVGSAEEDEVKVEYLYAIRVLGTQCTER